MPRSNGSIFTFENIVFLSDRDLLRLLKEIDNVTLLRACAHCDDLLISRITAQFSRTARDYFFADLVKIGKITDDEAIEAKEKIGAILSSLYERGKLRDWNTKYAA